MQSFIHRKNIELFKRRLSEAATEEERKAVEKLLEEELAKERRQKERNLKR